MGRYRAIHRRLLLHRLLTVGSLVRIRLGEPTFSFAISRTLPPRRLLPTAAALEFRVAIALHGHPAAASLPRRFAFAS